MMVSKFSHMIKIALIVWVLMVITDVASAWHRHGHHRHFGYHHYNRHHFDRHHYHRHHYRHPWHSYHDYPRYRVSYTLDDGWRLLQQNRSREALTIFEKLNQSSPGAGLPKLGVSIAAADTGNLSKSITAMRRALVFHPGALYQFKYGPQLGDTLKRLILKYRESDAVSENDVYFMQAALYFLLKDKPACLQAVNRIKQGNDTSDSARNLFYMVEHYL